MKIKPLLIAAAITASAGCVPTADSGTSPPTDDAPSAAPTTTEAPHREVDRARLSAVVPAGWANREEVPFRSPEPLPPPPPKSPLSAGPVEIRDVSFAVGSAVLTEAAATQLEAVASEAQATLQPGQWLQVDGYVDETGDHDFNVQLADDRARMTVDRLIRLAPTLEGRIRWTGHGPTDLRDQTCRGDCPTNRVVLITVQPS